MQLNNLSQNVKENHLEKNQMHGGVLQLKKQLILKKKNSKFG